ncbi:MAG: hypothetical protein U9M89_01030 [Patescibacteria group bacterium]|nr:hypothetical protein [Patescibacteria group bacterium]
MAIQQTSSLPPTTVLNRIWFPKRNCEMTNKDISHPIEPVRPAHLKQLLPYPMPKKSQDMGKQVGSLLGFTIDLYI